MEVLQDALAELANELGCSDVRVESICAALAEQEADVALMREGERVQVERHEALHARLRAEAEPPSALREEPKDVHVSPSSFVPDVTHKDLVRGLQEYTTLLNEAKALEEQVDSYYDLPLDLEQAKSALEQCQREVARQEGDLQVNHAPW